MQTPPIYSYSCMCGTDHDNHDLDLRSRDNLVVVAAQVTTGVLQRDRDDIAVVGIAVGGEQYVGEPNSTSETVVMTRSQTILIPLAMMQALCAPINDAIAIAEDRVSASNQ